MKFEQNSLRGFSGGRLEVLTGARTDDEQKVITIAHPEHSSGELKMRCNVNADEQRLSQSVW